MLALTLAKSTRFLTIYFCFILVACSPDNQQKTKQGLVYCSEGSPASFNPQLDTSGTTVDATAHQIYDRLLDFDPVTGKIVPGLASSWLVSADGLIYTFQLRREVSFHETDYFKPTRFFNADDVVFTIDRWRDPNHPFYSVSGGHYPYFSSLGLDKVVADVKRINGYRVEIHLHKPDSSFLANLATDFAVILSKQYSQQLITHQQLKNIDLYPIGTGPYKFVHYRKDSHIRYRKHQKYWKHQQTPEQLIFDITPSSSLRLAKLMTGECDAIAFPSQTELEILRQEDELRLDVKPGLNVGFWAFNTQKAPFDNPNVRRALAMAIDKNTLLEAVYFDSAVSAKSLAPPTSWAYHADIKDVAYNPVAARKLLAENGIISGFSMNIWAMPIERAYNPNATKMAEIMRQYLADVGIDVNIISYNWSTFRKRLSQGLHDSVLIGWSADNGDPDNFYRPILSCAAISSGTNRAMWCNPEYDKLIKQALEYSDADIRREYYRQANVLVAEQLPLVPIAHAYRYQAYRNNVSGLNINPYGGIRLGDVTLK